ncbi:hypothetical protein B0A67_24505 [Flavobacterium aquidurense]|uniref:hypothetical protein n=1 Tax=Flavobacterium aquidurense TaxID=362413 RepID=UPI000B5B9FE2|nr:hypothetical protein [Flavobacterium aquidurense]OXA65332.1 hypothetical protein B0A67_24505 [Flavobacterium aquidurense]
MAVNVKISETAKESLDWLKTNYQFNNFSDCINTIGTFFKSNYVSPRETISNNYSESLAGVKSEIVDLRKFISDDSQSLRKRFGAIERDYYILTNRKIDAVYKILLESSIDKTNSDIAENILNNDSVVSTSDTINPVNNNDDIVLKLKREIAEYDTQIKSYSSIVDSQENTFKEYKKVLNNLKKNLGYEKNTFGKTKVVIDLEKEEVEAMFNLLDKL